MADLQRQIENYLANVVTSNRIPGLTVAVVRGGDIAYLGAFGVRRIGGEEPLTSQHVFHFASVSKPFVATAIMQLVEQEKMALDDRLVEILPYFELADEDCREITIRQMLSHTSGMPDVEDYEWQTPQYDDGAAERFVRSVSDRTLLWPPGRQWQYSNLAFDILGDVIAKVSGMSFGG